MLRDYKYRGRQEVAPLLSQLMGEAVGRAPWGRQVEAVVPVPTHWRRRLSQKIDVVDALSESVARSLELPVVRALRRVRFNGSQVGLSYTARQENVRGAFAVARGIKLDGPTLLLVDDVRTTGATLGECARTLKRAGAKEVFAAVVARVCYSDKRDVADLPV